MAAGGVSARGAARQHLHGDREGAAGRKDLKRRRALGAGGDAVSADGGGGVGDEVMTGEARQVLIANQN